MSSKDGGRNNMEKPLKGAVLCCTSIAPEQRTHMAEAAIQMGAEHNLDLTSDVTHLIVGDNNTLKYKYVAKEREDVKVLQLAWVEAVRQAWMHGDDFNLEALEDEHRLPTFAGLRICVTGFEDLTFRAQLQEAISANGGEYRGDLTKEVTHLIACTPEGKKYQYATQWDIKVVGLKWLKDSLDRRMILDEALYHPTVPKNKLGQGAWNRQARAEVQLGKRTRDEETVPDVPRKLRRTASVKLGSQSESLWSEIVSGPPGEDSANAGQLRPSKSLPILKPAVLESKSFATDSTGIEDDRRRSATRDATAVAQPRSRRGIFSGFGFFLYAFTSKQMSILRDHILSNDGEIREALTNSAPTATFNLCRLFLVVPYCHPFSDIPSVEHLDPSPEIVTDMWAERCLQSKKFFEPDEHVLSRPIPVFPIPGFEKLAINSTGVADIDLLHVSKAVNLLGARYDQILKAGISVLLCNPSKAGEDKLRHAREWSIPAVSIEWLWACIRSRQMQSFRTFLLKQGQNPGERSPALNAVAPPRRPEYIHTKGREQPAENGPQAKPVHSAKDTVPQGSLSEENDSNHASRAQRAKLAPGEGFVKSPRRREDGSQGHGKKLAPMHRAGAADKHEPQENCDSEAEDAGIGLPLQEISTNSPPKSEKSPSPRKARLFRRFDGQSSVPSRDQDNDTPSAPEATSTGKTTYIPPRAESINGAIQELLGKSKAKNATPTVTNGENKKKRLLGRALSNMSNSSREGTNVRASRASSIDSVNTDGLGSVILDETSGSRRNSSGAGGRSNFAGRASAQGRGGRESSLELSDAALYREEYREEREEAPQMTQLGYDNPDDAVALREMLAERRRNRTRRGQEDVKPLDSKEGKRIKDDVSVAPAGWGAGRRTRHKAKSPG